MRPRHPTAIALAASLACHATLVLAALHFGAYERVGVAPGGIIEALPPPEERFGEHGGLGEALNSLAAPQEAQSPYEAQDQPLLGLLPEGPLRPQAPTASEMLALAEERMAIPSSASMAELSEAMGATTRSTAPNETSASAAVAPAQANADPTEEAAPVATDPGPPAGREVDLFTKEAFAEHRAGQTVARDGREFRIRGMRRGLVAFMDQALLPRPVVVRFVLLVDKEGTPVEVHVEKSSGSQALDQQIRKELFNSWFDPDPSRTGKDLGKPFRFTIRIV